MYLLRNTFKKRFTAKVDLKIVLMSFYVILSIFIPLKCPHFYVLSHSTKLALKHLFGVKEAGIRSKVCNLFLQTRVRDYVILTLICLIFQCAQKRSKLLSLEHFFLNDCSLYLELLIMTKNFVCTFLDSLLNKKIVHNFARLTFGYVEMNQIPITVFQKIHNEDC